MPLDSTVSPLEEIVRTCRGSDGDRTKALYQCLEALGSAGIVAVPLLGIAGRNVLVN